MNRTGRPTTQAFNGMVATPHSLASAAGLRVLQDGGSAIDAVIAANAVLTVVYPDQTSIGGDCFLLYYDAATKHVHALNGSGRTPRAADRQALKAAGHQQMPARGIHSVTVPGTIDAWTAAHARFGRLEFARLLEPAIGYARDGFPVSPNVADSIAGAATREGSGDLKPIFYPGGTAPKAGTRLRLPDLANSLDLIAREGRDVFYTGSIAHAILKASARHGGVFTADDLADHRAEWVQPVASTYRDVTVLEFPPNSQGLTALIELNLAELAGEPATWGTADHLHPLIEAKKLAFAVRDRKVSDPAFTTIDTDHLTSKAYARQLWQTYDPAHAGEGTLTNTGDTVYLCAVDRDGNAASIIQSVYLDFGSGVVADGTGIVLQCRGAYFSLEDDHVNRLEGGKRTVHTLMPGMLLRDGELWGPIGTQGGDAQAQVHLQLITNLVDYGMEPQSAIEAPRWVAGGMPGSDPRLVGLESRFPEQTFVDLEKRGHVIRRTSALDVHYGHAQMILRDRETGLLRGGADPRADGVAVGY